MVGLAVLLGIGIVAAHDKAVAGETRLLNAQNQIIKFKLGHNCQATTDGTSPPPPKSGPIVWKIRQNCQQHHDCHHE